MELRGAEQLAAMRLVELRQVGEGSKPARDQILVGHWRHMCLRPRPRPGIATVQKPLGEGPDVAGLDKNMGIGSKKTIKMPLRADDGPLAGKARYPRASAQG